MIWDKIQGVIMAGWAMTAFGWQDDWPGGENDFVTDPAKPMAAQTVHASFISFADHGSLGRLTPDSDLEAKETLSQVIQCQA